MTDHKARRAILDELVSTEKMYVGLLALLQQHVAEPLAARLEMGTSSGGGGGLLCCLPEATPAFITSRNFEAIFGALPPVLAANHELLAQLEARAAVWSDSQTLGDLFIEWGHNLESAYLRYCGGYNKATRAYDTSRRSTGFASFIEEAEAQSLPCSVMAIMVSPVSRLPRCVCGLCACTMRARVPVYLRACGRARAKSKG
jgi:hypothetical protein